MKPAPKTSAKAFQAPLERGKWNLNWVIVHIPFDVAKLWGKRGQLRVKGDINGFTFRASLFPTGEGGHAMVVNKRMQAGAKASLGSVAKFHLEPDTEKRETVVPEELERTLSEDPALRRWFDQLGGSIRKWICEWIIGVKSAEARVRRADQIAERMLATMEAERELPPVLRLAFARNPGALEGWKLMSPSHRRMQLFAISYYSSPEARGRRVAKVIQEAYQFAERKSKRIGGKSSSAGI